MITSEPRRSRRLTVVLGLEHFIDKIGYHKQGLDLLDEEAIYVVRDASGHSEVIASKYGANITIVPNGLAGRLLAAARVLFRKRPVYAEIYHTGLLTWAYVLIARSAGARAVLVLRGQEFSRPRNTKQRLISLSGEAALRSANVIIAKEANLEREVKRRGLRCHTLHNSVPVPARITPWPERTIDVLYLNSVRPERHVIDLIQAANALLAEGLRFNISIVGFSIFGPGHNAFARDYEEECIAAIKASGFEHCYALHGFTDEPRRFLNSARLFVFPADIVFANYALLEAMSEGCVPIVYPGEGHARIIDHGVNGFVADARVPALTERLRICLGRDIDLASVTQQARNTVEATFSLRAWASAYDQARAVDPQDAPSAL